MKKIFTNILLLLFSLLGCSSCVFEKFGECPDPAVERDKAEYVYLNMNVAVASSVIEPKTRAGEVVDDNNYFEGPASKYERMNTLRVIIVRSERNNLEDGIEDNSGIIEHNHLFKFNDAGIVLFDDMIFKVIGGEKKKIYLVANEEFLKSKNVNFDDLKVENEYPTDFIEDIILTTEAGSPLIDNSETSDKQYYIPMSEVFELDVPTPQNPADYEISKSYFITRAAVKFSFNILTPNTYHYPAYDSGLRVKNITVHEIGNTEYFLPRNTVYEPAKYDDTNFPLNGRFITEYELPSTPAPVNKEFAFTAGLENLVLNYTEDNKGVHPYIPFVYFPESYKDKYSISITLGDPEDSTKDFTFEPAELTNLPALPRNTHVLVNITLKDAEIEATVKLVPYIGVYLNYPFGFEDLVDWKRPDDNNNDEPSLEGDNTLQDVGPNDPGTPGIPNSGS